jgi:hypothetical protein
MVLKPKGRMTKPLASPYEVGDVVRLVLPLDSGSEPVGSEPVDPIERRTADAVAFALRLHGVRPDRRPAPRVGDIGVIRRVWIADPNDGDCTFLAHDVKWHRIGRIIHVGANEIEPASKNRRSKGDAWLRRQIQTLNAKEDGR